MLNHMHKYGSIIVDADSVKLLDGFSQTKKRHGILYCVTAAPVILPISVNHKSLVTFHLQTLSAVTVVTTNIQNREGDTLHNEPRRKKTCLRGSDQVRHKQGCTATEDG